MFVKERMTPNPITVGGKEPVALAVQLMLEKNIRHLPVVEKGKVLGVLSYADIMHILPATIANLESGNEDSSLRKTKIKDILPLNQRVVSCTEGTCLEDAALIMRSYKVGCLPVLDDAGKIQGLITRTDVFDAFIDVLGMRSDGTRLNIRIEDKPGIVAEIGAVVRSFDANITRMVIVPEGKGQITMLIRVKSNNIEGIKEALRLHGYEAISPADYRRQLQKNAEKEKQQ